MLHFKVASAMLHFQAAAAIELSSSRKVWNYGYLVWFTFCLLSSSSVHSAAFLLLYGIELAIEGWRVVASLKVYPPFAGAAVSAVTLVVAFCFAVSRQA